MLALQKLSRGVSLQYLKRFSSSAVTAATKPTADLSEETAPRKTSSNSLVAAAFASLKDESPELSHENSTTNEKQPKTIDEKIITASSVSSLLAITEGNGQLTRKQALKVVSILAEWSSINRAKLSDFETDARFLRLCKILGRTVPKSEQTNNSRKAKSTQSDDLSTVLGIAGDDEAAKLIASISLPQMVKVMSTLAQRKRRSTPLLRSLAFNISSNSEQLDLKQSADVLYSMASLNFPDSVLTAKVCVDIQSTLPSNDKPAVIGSILTSMGLLKYRDIDLLESLSKWILCNSDKCRPQDISAMFLTLATLNYKVQDLENLKKKVVNTLCAEDFPKRSDWLNHVWALTLLKIVDSKQINSVLSSKFLEQLESERKELTPNAKLKLLNINAYAKIMGDMYKGNLLQANSDVFTVPLAHTKSKQILLNGLLDALKSLMTSSTYVKSLVDTKMGFLIDAQCMFDSRRNPLPVDQEEQEAIKVAIMIVDFHDTCHGTHRAITGHTNFAFEMLESRGFKICAVPYYEFNTSDKLLKRVQYLEKQFKSIVSERK